IYATVRPKGRTGTNGLTTYTAAMFAMALAEHGEPQAAADGSGERTFVLDAADTAWMQELVRFLEETQDEGGRWSYGYDGKRALGYFDNSNGQVALLALKCASRAGVRARDETWLRA